MTTKKDPKKLTREEMDVICSNSIRNKQVLESTDLCGCFYCIKTFDVSVITDWHQEKRGGSGETAWCPFCGTDAVIPLDANDDNVVLLKSLFNRSFHIAYQYVDGEWVEVEGLKAKAE